MTSLRFSLSVRPLTRDSEPVDGTFVELTQGSGNAAEPDSVGRTAQQLPLLQAWELRINPDLGSANFHPADGLADKQRLYVPTQHNIDHWKQK